MRVLMFTPTVKRSAIGRMASLVTGALTRMGHAVVVVRTEDQALIQWQTHDFGTEVVGWNQVTEVEALVHNADWVIYQVGDNYAYHQGCLEWLPRVPGVVCLHDFFLGNLFTGWAQEHQSDAAAVLRAWYGEEATKCFFGYPSSDEFIAATKDTAPMTEWVASMACAVVTHSSWGLQRVLDACPGPVEVVPLAYSPDALAWMRSITQPEEAAEFVILTIGHVNANKRAQSVIRAIGNSNVLPSRTTYRLVGAIEPAAAEQLSALASSVGVRLVVSGEVDPEALASAMTRADVVCCLRWPSLEAASASTIEAMLYGKPVIVTDTGFYSELPNDCVQKIRPQNEIQDLQQALELLYLSEEARVALGTAAAKWASTTFTADNYASRLVDVSLAAQRAAPMIRATCSLTGLLQRWGASCDVAMLPDTIEPLRFFDDCQSGA